MANKPVTLKKKNGDVYLPKTSVAQVIGLADELAAKQPNLTTAQLDAVNSGATAALVSKITANEAAIAGNATAITGINDVIPSQATTENQLADKDFVNSSVQTMSADLIALNAAGDPFPTKAALDGATDVYHGNKKKKPDEHDYCIVLADETHGGAQTRYSYSGGVWAFQYLVNDTPFTAAQNAAINSGITSEKVAELDALAAGNGDLLSKSEAAETYTTLESFAGLGGTVRYVQPGADLSSFGDNDLIVELEVE